MSGDGLWRGAKFSWNFFSHAAIPKVARDSVRSITHASPCGPRLPSLPVPGRQNIADIARRVQGEPVPCSDFVHREETPHRWFCHTDPLIGLRYERFYRPPYREPPGWPFCQKAVPSPEHRFRPTGPGQLFFRAPEHQWCRHPKPLRPDPQKTQPMLQAPKPPKTLRRQSPFS